MLLNYSFMRMYISHHSSIVGIRKYVGSSMNYCSVALRRVGMPLLIYTHVPTGLMVIITPTAVHVAVNLFGII